MDKIDKLLNLYTRKGGKANRNEQVLRIRKVLKFSGIVHPEHFGSHHLNDFYKHLRDKGTSERTQYYYYLSMCILYDALNRKEPPKPLFMMNKGD